MREVGRIAVGSRQQSDGQFGDIPGVVMESGGVLSADERETVAWLQTVERSVAPAVEELLGHADFLPIVELDEGILVGIVGEAMGADERAADLVAIGSAAFRINKIGVVD